MTTSNFPTRTAVSEADDGKSWIQPPPSLIDYIKPLQERCSNMV